MELTLSSTLATCAWWDPAWPSQEGFLEGAPWSAKGSLSAFCCSPAGPSFQDRTRKPWPEHHGEGPVLCHKVTLVPSTSL